MRQPWAEADGDVAEAIDFCEFYAREMIQYVQERFPQLRGADESAVLAFLRTR